MTINDIDLIESALLVSKRDLSMKRLEGTSAMLPESAAIHPLREIDDLLGRLHGQKVFYRPQKTPYVSG